MDQRRFDELARNLGATNSRRNVLKGLLGGFAGAVGLLGGGSALAGKGGGSNKPDCCPSTAPRLCNNQCVDFNTDPNNCGSCGAVCPTGSTCQNGACICPAGTTLCGNQCVDTSSDSTNCGACGNQCGTGESCLSGTCQAINCDDGNPCTTDVFDSSTGQCAHNPVPDGTVCSTGSGSGVCSNGVCVVGSVCTPGATQSCYSGPAGTAGVGICTAGVQTCQPDGTWGACVGEVLPQPETCNGLDDDCNGVIDNGFDLQNDVNNCGACGNVCFVANGMAGCVNGQCTIQACNPGFADCDGIYATGCEADVQSNPANCGACGNVCPSGICSNGTCA